MHPVREPLLVHPIGIIRTPFADRVSAPRQPSESRANGTIELDPGRGFEFALEDLAEWQYIWLLFWFHLNHGWKAKVLPPRSDRKRGVFSTRSPHRPNPIGMSVVELVSVEGLRVHVRGVDLVDGTPIVDIKPYVPYSDALPDARTGWLRKPSDPIERYRVTFSERAKIQLDWLHARHVDVTTPLLAVLETSPKPHPYRRIRTDGAGYRLALHEWRVFFTLDGQSVHVDRLASGYRPTELADQGRTELSLHRAFVERFA